MGILCKPLKRHRTSGCIADQALQLVTPMGGNLGVGVQGKAVDTGTAGACQRGAFPCVAKA